MECEFKNEDNSICGEVFLDRFEIYPNYVFESIAHTLFNFVITHEVLHIVIDSLGIPIDYHHWAIEKLYLGSRQYLKFLSYYYGD
jgi:hypothetical protein